MMASSYAGLFSRVGVLIKILEAQAKSKIQNPKKLKANKKSPLVPMKLRECSL
jgi:hypothetical protein